MRVLVIFLTLFLAVPVLGHDPADDSTKYEVTFTVRYNAVSAAKAAEITGAVLRRHGSACKVEVETKKAWDSIGVTWGNATATITSPTGIIE